MIELRNLTKSYVFDSGGRRFVFRDLSFTFPDAVNIGLIGRNGAGKSTLMRLLGGIDVPDRGRVVTDKTISWPIGLQGGFNGTLSGRDNVKFVCRIYGSNRAEMQDRVHQVQEFAEIGEYFDRPVKSYSSGMRSRLAFGLSMAFHFDYYLIDEVMAVGDAQFKRKSKAALSERLKQSNLILVSHNMQEIAKLCDVVVLVKDGGASLYEDVREGIRAYQAEDPGAAIERGGPQARGGPRAGGRGAARPGGPGPQGKRRPGAGGPGRPGRRGPGAGPLSGPRAAAGRNPMVGTAGPRAARQDVNDPHGAGARRGGGEGPVKSAPGARTMADVNESDPRDLVTAAVVELPGPQTGKADGVPPGGPGLERT